MEHELMNMIRRHNKPQNVFLQTTINSCHLDMFFIPLHTYDLGISVVISNHLHHEW
jgi:hypothetical protein